jgi:membrane-associated phospholipid phosphatase
VNIRRLTRYLHSADVLLIGFLTMLSLIDLIFASRIPRWKELVGINVVVITAVCCLAYFRHTTGIRALRYLHDWYIAPGVFLSFKELYFMIHPLHGRDYDVLLIAADRWLFGVDPTHWISQFAHPVLTEILQLAYTSFYFLFLLVGYELYRRKNFDLFHLFMFTCVYGFFLSYLGYFSLPAIGPRFTLHDFSALDQELPGLWLTPSLRWFVNAGESIPMNVPNDIAIAETQRDVFPSGHTMMMLVLLYMAYVYRSRWRYLLTVIGALLIVATVYQRYHYVVDLMGGALAMVFCVATSRPLYEFLKARLLIMESRMPPAEGTDG